MKNWSNYKLAAVIGLSLSALFTAISILVLVNPRSEFGAAIARYADIPTEAFCGFLGGFFVYTLLAAMVLAVIRRDPTKSTYESSKTTNTMPHARSNQGPQHPSVPTEAEHGLKKPVAGRVICKGCGLEIWAGYDKCWKCGTPLPGK